MGVVVGHCLDTLVVDILIAACEVDTNGAWKGVGHWESVGRQGWVELGRTGMVGRLGKLGLLSVLGSVRALDDVNDWVRYGKHWLQNFCSI